MNSLRGLGRTASATRFGHRRKRCQAYQTARRRVSFFGPRRVILCSARYYGHGKRNRADGHGGWPRRIPVRL